MKYLDMPLLQALQQKSRKGHERYNPGGSAFIGDPLEELFQECLDAMNYCDELKKRGIDLQHRRSQFWATALEIQGMYRFGRARTAGLLHRGTQLSLDFG